MTQIIANYPPEFQRIEYTAYWQDIEKKFENSFGNLEKLTVKIHVRVMENGEQMEVNISESDNTATLDIYFVRYFRNKKLTPLSNPEDFYAYIQAVLNRASEDFK